MLACSCRRKTSSQRENQHQHLQLEQSKFPKSDYDQLSVYDEIVDLDRDTKEAHDNTYDVPDDELTDLDKGPNETYDHPDAVPGRSVPNPYEDLNAANATYDVPDDEPLDNATDHPDAELGRSMTPPHQDLNEATTEPTTTPHVYLQLIGVAEEKNGKSEC